MAGLCFLHPNASTQMFGCTPLQRIIVTVTAASIFWAILSPPTADFFHYKKIDFSSGASAIYRKVLHSHSPRVSNKARGLSREFYIIAYYVTPSR